MNVNETRGDYSALCVKGVVTASGGIDLADLSDGAIFDENGCGLFVVRSVEQTAIGYNQLLCHIDCRIIDLRFDYKTEM